MTSKSLQEVLDTILYNPKVVTIELSVIGLIVFFLIYKSLSRKSSSDDDKKATSKKHGHHRKSKQSKPTNTYKESEVPTRSTDSDQNVEQTEEKQQSSAKNSPKKGAKQQSPSKKQQKEESQSPQKEQVKQEKSVEEKDLSSEVKKKKKNKNKKQAEETTKIPSKETEKQKEVEKKVTPQKTNEDDGFHLVTKKYKHHDSKIESGNNFEKQEELQADDEDDHEGGGGGFPSKQANGEDDGFITVQNNKKVKGKRESLDYKRTSIIAEPKKEIPIKTKEKITSIDPAETELKDLSKASSQLWRVDKGYCIPQKDYKLNLQGNKQVNDNKDLAKNHFFKHFDKHIFERDCYKQFVALLDSYQAGVEENYSSEQQQLIKDFLQIVIEQPSMKYCHKYLVKKGKAEKSDNKFSQQLYDLWFSLYKKKSSVNTCGFKNVFVGETVDDRIIGFNNWIQIHLQEKHKNLNYLGYIRSKDQEPSVKDNFLTISYDCAGYLKKSCSSFYGTSPQFELAFYTLMFLCAEDNQKIKVQNFELIVKIEQFHTVDHHLRIGTIYPTILTETPSSTKQIKKINSPSKTDEKVLEQK